MAHKWGLRLWGGTGDDLLDTNADPWTDSVGSIKHSVGGHTPLTMGAPNTLDGIFMGDATRMVDPQNDFTTQAWVSVYGPSTAGVPADHYAAMDAADTYERIIFTGTYADYEATLPNPAGSLRFSMQGDDSKLFNRRPGIPSDTNADIGAVLTAIEGAITSPGISGEHDRFPDEVAGYLQDMPASGTDSVGSILQKLTAPYGMWAGVEWDHTLDASDDITSGPTMLWRPSWQSQHWRTGSSADISGVDTITTQTPWLWRYKYGRRYGDHPNKVTVTGVGGAEGDYTHGAGFASGWAGASVSTYIDNNSECDQAAKHLAKMCGPYGYPRISEATINVEHGYKRMVAAGVDPDLAETMMWRTVAARIGDTFKPLTVATGTETWAPIACPERYGQWATDEQLADVVRPYQRPETTDSEARLDYWVISQVKREWHYLSGWTVTLGLMPGRVGEW